jgi:hypothetical protein
MASWSSIHIKTNDISRLENIINSYSEFKLIKNQKFPEDFYDSYLMFSNEPNLIILGQTQENWVTFRYNCLYLQDDYCEIISKELNTIVCSIIAQSAVNHIEFCKYENGIKVRHFISSPENESKNLDFGDPIKEELEFGEESKDFFYFNDVCALLGLEIQSDYDIVNWDILKKETNELTTSDFTKKLIKRRPWWKFW